VARINELSPEQVKNEIMQPSGSYFWQTYKNFIPSSLEVFWNGQKLVSYYDYSIVDDQTVEILGVNVSNYDDVIKRDVIVCNYLVKN
jgi:uncharacterized protein (UPF0333 family)